MLNRLDQLAESATILTELLPKYRYIVDTLMSVDHKRVRYIDNLCYDTKHAIEILISALGETFRALKYPSPELLSETYYNRFYSIDASKFLESGRIC